MDAPYPISLSQSSGLLQAEWIVPIAQPPIYRGVIEYAEHKIVQVRAYRPGDAPHDLGQLAILPQFINAHTHLEFSNLTSPIGSKHLPFSEWIRAVIGYRIQEQKQHGEAWRPQAIEQGINLSLKHGVIALGEIVTIPCMPTWYEHRSSMHTTLFLELLGMAETRLEPLWLAAQQQIAQSVVTGMQMGLSPHAPYTVHPTLLERVCQLSREKQFPIAMHLAESADELQLLQSGSGKLADFLREVGATTDSVLPRNLQPMHYLQTLSEAHYSLIIHGNYLQAGEIEFLAQHASNMSLVYCPRTHAYLFEEEHPLLEMLQHGVHVALGTDSLATNPDLNLWHEMLFLRKRYAGLSAETILKFGTQHGAQALGIQNQFGSLESGKSVHQLMAVPVPKCQLHNIYDRLMEV